VRVPPYRLADAGWDDGRMPGTPRFLTLADVAEVLSTSSAQVYALVRRGDLPAIKIGGRGQWRVEASELEEYIQRMYAETRTFVEKHPYVEADSAE
jgi:excisionase family DNA binding protein